MSREKGMLIKCDRCGKSVFLPRIGEDIRDGGFTRTYKHEEPPEGWLRITDSKFKDLCPECGTAYSKMLTEFEAYKGGE